MSFKFMNNKQRIDFYLGPELSKSDVDIKNEKDTQTEIVIITSLHP